MTGFVLRKSSRKFCNEKVHKVRDHSEIITWGVETFRFSSATKSGIPSLEDLQNVDPSQNNDKMWVPPKPPLVIISEGSPSGK